MPFIKLRKMRKQKSVKLWGTYTSTILSISLVLFVFGLLLILGLHSYQYTNDIQEGVMYNVILSPDTEEANAMELQKRLQDRKEFPYVKTVYYISKDEAARNFSQELGEDFVEFTGYNPLFPSLEVTLKSDFLQNNNAEHRRQFVEKLKHTPFVTDVVYQETMVDELNDIFAKVGWFMAIITVLLLFVSIMLINCTIKLVIHSKRYIIKTMQLVGAKRSFIIAPFLRKSILYGFLGGIIASALLGTLTYIINSQLGIGIDYVANEIPYIAIGTVLLLFGIIISLCSTYLSLVHYLRKDNDQLY